MAIEHMTFHIQSDVQTIELQRTRRELTIGSLSNDDGDGNENATKQ